ncbi:hypothetical protein DRJ17_02250 [Candidatus Woesearchaeota archaeon]|nr:MAG: hypothetical protein DRJ17_02250 [Candidatus Woesearchaeota archaeon]
MRNTKSQEEMTPEEVLEICRKCGARCCRYVSYEMDEPENKRDFDDFRWFVMHKNVNIYYDTDGDWVLEFLTPCENLTADLKCKIHENRPMMCRGHDVNECEEHGEGELAIVRFDKPEDVDKFIKEKGIKFDNDGNIINPEVLKMVEKNDDNKTFTK